MEYEPSMFEVWDLTIGKIIRKRMRESSPNRCYCCHTKNDITDHHIIPKEFGGPDTEENKVHLCETCHKMFHESRFFQNLPHLTDKLFLERLEKLRLFKELEREFEVKR